MKNHYYVRLAFKPWEAQKIVHIGNYPESIARDMAHATAKDQKAPYYSIFLETEAYELTTR